MIHLSCHDLEPSNPPGTKLDASVARAMLVLISVFSQKKAARRAAYKEAGGRECFSGKAMQEDEV
jgi:hypothetical protein